VGTGWFEADGAVLTPTEDARGAWRPDSLHGVALCGALARAAELTVARLGRDDLQPARISVDLFAAPVFAPCELATEVVREGRRICLVDVRLTQHGRRVARASAAFLQPGDPAPGRVWAPGGRHEPPPVELVPAGAESRVPLVDSGDGWSGVLREHQNAGRKLLWGRARPVVVGEAVTPFQAAASAADTANIATGWGEHGVEHINTDVTLVLARLPEGDEIGLAAEDRVEHAGVAVATASVFDRSGPLGSVAVTTLANTQQAVDIGARS
jgi:acyl-coenzyme A thioesterase PaaI-like protein